MAVILRTSALLTGIGTAPCFLSSWYLPGTVGGSNADATNCLAHFRSVWNVLAAKISTPGVITYDPTTIAMEATTGKLTGAFVGTSPANSTCAAGTSPLPAQTQGLIAWGTNGVVENRRVRGRWFIPSPDEGDNTGTPGGPSSSYTSQLSAAVTAMMVAPAGGNLPVIWHRPDPGGSNGSHHVITGGAPRFYWTSQRGRR
jgi:hypothetical protein